MGGRGKDWEEKMEEVETVIGLGKINKLKINKILRKKCKLSERLIDDHMNPLSQ